MKKLIKAPYIDQTKAYPTGCESVSAVMLLHYLGLPLTVDEFIGRYLHMEPMLRRDGKLYGPNPYECFAGSPYDADAFGCYPPVVIDALNRVFLDAKLPKKAVDLTGMPMGEMISCFVDREMPVLFWASIDLKETVAGPDWHLPDGALFSWISNEHCMLLTGYDDASYYFNDPWHNHGCIAYPKPLVEQRHKEQREMAAAVIDSGI